MLNKSLTKWQLLNEEASQYAEKFHKASPLDENLQVINGC